MSTSVHQSYRDVFVTNNPALLQTGYTDQLAVEQIGIFLYDPKKDPIALAAPNFATAKAIQIVQGTPDTPTNTLAAIANQSDKSKPIKGKKIISWTGRAAQRGQNQIITIGYDGVDTAKNLTARCEETRMVFIKLSGGPIDEIFHTEGKGIVRQYSVWSGCCDDCGDDCAEVGPAAMAEDLARQINLDPIFSLGNRIDNTVQPTNRLIRAKVIYAPGDAPTPSSTCQEYTLSICDSGDSTALGIVQSQVVASGDTYVSVERIARVGSISTYQGIFPEGTPGPISNAGFPLIADCPDCPDGYTLVEAANVYKIQREDAGDGTALANVISAYTQNAVVPTASRIQYQYGTSTYVLSSTEELSAVAPDTLVFIGEARNTCVLDTPTLTPWVAGDVYNRFAKTYQLTITDQCETTRLAEIQAAYPNDVVTLTTDGTCAGLYSLVRESNCVPPGCPPDVPLWIHPEPFDGIEWKEVEVDDEATPVGVQLESAFVDRIANECAFIYWRYDAEPIFIEVSQHDQDYNGRPTICANEWPVTEIQAVKLPIGVGSRVREDEVFFKGYRRKYWDVNPIVRELQDSVIHTDPKKFYDQYTLEFAFTYHQSWFSEQNVDTYRLEVYFPEGQGKQFEAAINGYVASIGIDLDPVVL